MAGSLTSPPPGSAPPSRTTSWADVLGALDDRRSAAFVTGDADGLEEVYATGSAPLARDAAALADLSARGLHAVGLRLDVEAVEVMSVDTEAATLQVVDRLAPYRLVDNAGAVVATEPGRGPVTWELTVTAVEGGWRISEIERATRS